MGNAYFIFQSLAKFGKGFLGSWYEVVVAIRLRLGKGTLLGSLDLGQAGKQVDQTNTQIDIAFFFLNTEL